MTKTHLTNAHTAILHESFIAGAYKRAKGVCTGGVFWTGSIDLTFIYICGELRINTFKSTTTVINLLISNDAYMRQIIACA